MCPHHICLRFILDLKLRFASHYGVGVFLTRSFCCYSKESPRGRVGPARGGPEHEQDPAAAPGRRQGQVSPARSAAILGCLHPVLSLSTTLRLLPSVFIHLFTSPLMSKHKFSPFSDWLTAFII